MSSISVNSITTLTANADLQLATGNGTGPYVLVNAAGGISFYSNSTVNAAVISTSGSFVLNRSMTLEAPAGTGNAYISFTSSNSNRWVVTKNTTAESGSNTGSDFAVYRYSDTGAYLGQPLLIQRSNGYSRVDPRLEFSSAASYIVANTTHYLINHDNTDYQVYNKSTNQFELYIGGTKRYQVESSGRFTAYGTNNLASGNTGNATGDRYVSTSDPSGGSDGDLWLKV